MKHKGQAGFTIVEIIIGLAVMGIFALALTIAVTNLSAINDRARDLVLANGLAENKVESLRSADFVALSDGTFDFTADLPASFEGPRSADYIVSTINASLKQIEVRISYTDDGKPRNLSYNSYIGELGVGQ